MPTYQFLTDRSLAQSTAITPTTIIHIVTTADTTQSVYGSSYKAELQQLIPIFSGSTFSGGSGNCITDLYVSNLYGCSPIIIHDNLVIESGVTITSTNGGGQIELDYALQPSNILISTDNGGVAEAFINLQPTDLNLGSLNGDVRIQSLNSNNFRSGNLFSNRSQILMEPDFVKIGVVDPSAVFSNDYESVVVYNTLSSDQSTSNGNKWPVTVSSKNSTILSGVRNSVILGGSDITASTNNTVYVDNLNIAMVPYIFLEYTFISFWLTAKFAATPPTPPTIAPLFGTIVLFPGVPGILSIAFKTAFTSKDASNAASIISQGFQSHSKTISGTYSGLIASPTGPIPSPPIPWIGVI
jgi:hypothetical protein